MNRQTFPSRIPIGLLLGGMAAVLSLAPTFAVFRSHFSAHENLPTCARQKLPTLRTGLRTCSDHCSSSVP
jgi:hypothetical protein